MGSFQTLQLRTISLAPVAIQTMYRVIKRDLPAVAVEQGASHVLMTYGAAPASSSREARRARSASKPLVLLFLGLELCATHLANALAWRSRTEPRRAEPCSPSLLLWRKNAIVLSLVGLVGFCLLEWCLEGC